MTETMILIVLAVVLAFLAGIVLGSILKIKPVTVLLETLKKATTMKSVVWICLANGIAWVWCSYLLAYLKREDIAESLSNTAVKEIVGVVLVYAVKSLIENLSKNNIWPDKPVRKNTQQDCDA